MDERADDRVGEDGGSEGVQPPPRRLGSARGSGGLRCKLRPQLPLYASRHSHQQPPGGWWMWLKGGEWVRGGEWVNGGAWVNGVEWCDEVV